MAGSGPVGSASRPCDEGDALNLREDARTEENLAYLDRLVVSGATQDDENSWRGAVTYDGETYSGKVTMRNANALTLKGCQGMFCKSMNFVRL